MKHLSFAIMFGAAAFAPQAVAAPHTPYPHCCIYHDGMAGLNGTGRAGGSVTAETPGAIPCVGLAAAQPGKPVKPIRYFHAPLGDYDVLIDITYCGICHSDIHALDGEFGRKGDMSHFPYVAGHEAVGRIRAVGPKVTLRKVGDFVGMGCYKGFCGDCEPCAGHEEEYCEKSMLSYDFGGGMATCVVVPEDYAFPIPAAIPPGQAGPVLCAGVTTWSAVKQCGVKPGMQCAVVGFGGLGHMAAKIMKEEGATVTVFDINTAKATTAAAMGFKFVDAADDAAKWAMRSQFDVIIDTVPAQHDPNAYINMLKLHGRLHFVGLPTQPLPVMTPLVLLRNRTLTGSVVGSVTDHTAALAYCAEHKIFPEVKIIRADEVNDAIALLRANKGEFRYVIDMSTLQAGE